MSENQESEGQMIAATSIKKIVLNFFPKNILFAS